MAMRGTLFALAVALSALLIGPGGSARAQEINASVDPPLVFGPYGAFAEHPSVAPHSSGAAGVVGLLLLPAADAPAVAMQAFDEALPAATGADAADMYRLLVRVPSQSAIETICVLLRGQDRDYLAENTFRLAPLLRSNMSLPDGWRFVIIPSKHPDIVTAAGGNRLSARVRAGDCEKPEPVARHLPATFMKASEVGQGKLAVLVRDEGSELHVRACKKMPCDGPAARCRRDNSADRAYSWICMLDIARMPSGELSIGLYRNRRGLDAAYTIKLVNG